MLGIAAFVGLHIGLRQSLELSVFPYISTIAMPFKATLDLLNPYDSLIFVPTSQDLVPEDLNKLDRLNQKIRDWGGDPMKVDLEPENAIAE